MTDSKEPDHIGEVIAEDVAKLGNEQRALIRIGHRGSGKSLTATLVELSHQLADVSNERDELRKQCAGIYQQLEICQKQRDNRELRLNASEARNAELTELVRKIQVRLEASVGDEAEMSMDSMRLMLAYANEALFAQSAPATDEQGVV